MYKLLRKSTKQKETSYYDYKIKTRIPVIIKWGQVFDGTITIQKTVYHSNNDGIICTFDNDKECEISTHDLVEILKELQTGNFKFTKDNKIRGIFQIINRSGSLRLIPYPGEYKFNEETDSFELVTNWEKMTLLQRVKEEELQNVEENE